MNKFLLFFCVICLALPSFSANKITMVTYFPVPYVAYSKVTPKNQLDIGLTSSCQMNLGCAESGYSLNATTANLNRNRLDLNSAAAISSANVMVGSGYGPSNIDFAQNLRLGSLDRGYSLETNTMNVASLTLFASHMKSGGALFPDCRAKSGEETVSWQKLKLKDKEEVYLMCGTAKEGACNPPPGEPSSQACPSGYTGTQTRTWNYSTCKWGDWDTTQCERNSTCCLYKEKKYTEVTQVWRLDEMPSEYRMRTDEGRSLCVDFNPTQGTSFNCTDNFLSTCYDSQSASTYPYMGYDYWCDGGDDCPFGYNVVWYYKKCVLDQQKPCSEVEGLTGWATCD